MKTKIFLILNILLLVGCCKKVSLNPQTGLPWGWNPMPHERIKSYFPLKDGTNVMYMSEKKVKEFRCVLTKYNYNNTFGENYFIISKRLPYENCNVYVKLQRIKDGLLLDEMEYGINIYDNRTRMKVSYDYNYPKVKKGNFIREFEQDKTKDMGIGWPKNPNEFIDYLTDTIVLTQSNDPEKTMGMLVAGKGLVWFTDSDGIRWTLKE